MWSTSLPTRVERPCRRGHRLVENHFRRRLRVRLPTLRRRRQGPALLEPHRRLQTFLNATPPPTKQCFGTRLERMPKYCFYTPVLLRNIPFETLPSRNKAVPKRPITPLRPPLNHLLIQENKVKQANINTIQLTQPRNDHPYLPACFAITSPVSKEGA